MNWVIKKNPNSSILKKNRSGQAYNHAKYIKPRRAMMQNELIALMCGRLVIFPLWNKSFERIRVNLMIKNHSVKNGSLSLKDLKRKYFNKKLHKLIIFFSKAQPILIIGEKLTLYWLQHPQW